MADEPIQIDTPWRRDPDSVRPALERWARERVAPDAKVVEVGSPGNGMSSETVLFSMQRGDAVERYAARLAPLPEVYPVFPEYDLDAQRRCMELVREHTDVPAPVVAFHEKDPEWLGTPFVVMHRVDGEAPPDIPPYPFGGWLRDASREDQARLQRNAVSVLARLHEITPERVDLSFLVKPYDGSPLDHQLAHERAYYEWAREGVTYPLIERTFEWLEANRPPEPPAVLNWGDARIGNILFRDFEPVAVLDWEMATVGPPQVDIAWMIFLHRFFEDLAQRFGIEGMPHFMRRDDVVATYEELSGRTVGDLSWYEVFAALRFAIVSVRTSTRGIAYGQQERPEDPDDLVMFRGLLHAMVVDGTYWD